jgi:predicted  nucleic acid-binding Zn ribbon protein
MFFVELKFRVLQGSPTAAQENALWSLGGYLRRNGSLLTDALPVIGPEEFTISGVAPAKDALRKANWNKWVRQGIANLTKVHLSRPAIRFLGTVSEMATPCECKRQSEYFLFTTFLTNEPPLRCLRCEGTIPLYRLPPSKTEEHSGLLSWESNYQACDALQMLCRVGERFGERQMATPGSNLSRQGLEICRDIERLTKRPTYYYLYRFRTRSHATERDRKCPSCGGEWLLKKNLHRKINFKCDKCRLLSNTAP